MVLREYKKYPSLKGKVAGRLTELSRSEVLQVSKLSKKSSRKNKIDPYPIESQRGGAGARCRDSN